MFMHMSLTKALKRLECDQKEVDDHFIKVITGMEEIEMQMKQLKMVLYMKFGNTVNVMTDSNVILHGMVKGLTGHLYRLTPQSPKGHLKARIKTAVDITDRNTKCAKAHSTKTVLNWKSVTRPGIEPRTFWTYTRCSTIELSGLWFTRIDVSIHSHPMGQIT